jgi:uncharacterized membrane protein
MNEYEADAQGREIVGRGLSRKLGTSRAKTALADRRRGNYRFELGSHRSLGKTGFIVLMGAVTLINLVVGSAFYAMGAWPIVGFCGLDVALIYWAFKANYRSGRTAETVEVSPQMLSVIRTNSSGTRERYDFNPYWVRVRLSEKPDGRNELRLALHGQDFYFARFLSDDERRDFAELLTGALLAARSATNFSM